MISQWLMLNGVVAIVLYQFDTIKLTKYFFLVFFNWWTRFKTLNIILIYIQQLIYIYLFIYREFVIYLIKFFLLLLLLLVVNVIYTSILALSVFLFISQLTFDSSKHICIEFVFCFVLIYFLLGFLSLCVCNVSLFKFKIILFRLYNYGFLRFHFLDTLNSNHEMKTLKCK